MGGKHGLAIDRVNMDNGDVQRRRREDGEKKGQNGTRGIRNNKKTRQIIRRTTT